MTPADARGEARSRSGGRILIDQLQLHGIKQVFCVPGESFLDALDALHDSPIETIICRQEGGAAMAAEAQGELSGPPGICFVTRGPGVTNASPGIHIAHQDSTPLILFVGQIQRGHRDREAFQETELPMRVRHHDQMDDGDRRSGADPGTGLARFHLATSGRPGPVVIALPEDMLVERRDRWPTRGRSRRSPTVAAADVEKLRPCWPRPGAVRHPRRQRLGRDVRQRDAPSPNASRCRSPSSSGARCCSADHRLRRRLWASVPNRRLGSAPTLTCWSSSARGCPNLEPGLHADRDSDPEQRLVHVHPDPVRTRQALPPTWRSWPPRPHSAPRSIR